MTTKNQIKKQKKLMDMKVKHRTSVLKSENKFMTDELARKINSRSIISVEMLMRHPSILLLRRLNNAISPFDRHYSRLCLMVLVKRLQDELQMNVTKTSMEFAETDHTIFDSVVINDAGGIPLKTIPDIKIERTKKRSCK